MGVDVVSASGYPVWLDATGKPVACTEKIKVLNENLDELQQMAQDALEDAILMGCDEQQVRSVLTALVARLHNPYEDADQQGC